MWRRIVNWRDALRELRCRRKTGFYHGLLGAGTPAFQVAREAPVAFPKRGPEESAILKLEAEPLDKQIEGMRPNYEAELGDQKPLEEPDVDISLHPSRENPIAGELWSISGEIHNRSESPIWIVDHTTVLTLPPEMYGLSSQTGSTGAFFPTVQSRPTSEVVRIDPGAKYAVVWKLDPMSTRTVPGALQSIRKRVLNAIRNYAFFNPGVFRITSTIHVWSTKPEFDDGRVVNTGSSFVKIVVKELPMESSPWVLITGAACGGILCFLLQVLFRFSSTSPSWGWGSTILGLLSAIILCGVVTVLLSRLSTTDFLIVVKVKDIWGSIATGFVVQWFGYPLLQRILTAVGNESG